jgi:hypothetical protein
MASYTGQFVEGIEVDVNSMSDDEVDKCLTGCKGVLVCATGRDAFFPAGDTAGKHTHNMTIFTQARISSTHSATAKQ